MYFLVVSVVVTLLPLATAQCYGQSSSSVNSDQACDTGSNPTFCCPASSSCLSIGICKKSGKLFMGSCSSLDWSGQCTQYCGDNASISNCLINGSDERYCCSTGSNKNGQDRCCLGDTFPLGSLGDASVLPNTKLASSTSKQPSSTAKSTQKSTTSSASVKSTGKSSTVSDSTSSTLTTQTTGTASASLTISASDQSQITITSTQTSSPTAVPLPVSKGLSTGAKIGAGVGAALGFAFLGFSLFAIMFLCRRRQQDKRNAIRLSGLRAKAETSRSFSNNSGYTGVSDAAPVASQEQSSNFTATPIYAQQYSKPLPYHPRAITSIPESEHLLSPEPTPYDIPNPQGQSAITPIPQTAQRQVYRAYQPPPSPGRTETNELGFPHVRATSGPSFSELVTPTSAAVYTPPAPPSRKMTPAQELAAARARTNATPANPQSERRGEGLRREDSVVSGISGRSARDRERDRATLSRGNSVVSGRTEYRVSRQEP